ncbi:hypothetical protein [Fundidesulfovibrio magnetotacticus]|uniref:hypothetical protein n=1 Tax=Fundidesulfovibrio magnetotacticus TaxID=2730080 RepID=UPI001566065A|nr:hypothetical protein [Fundidesulfovibrio magnetotacticus]
MASLGVDIPQGEDVMLDVDGIGVRIVSDHARCVGINPTFRAYPVLLYTLGQDTYQLDAPTSWQQCLEFMDDPFGDADSGLARMSKLDFLDLFTQAELEALKGLEASVPSVAVFWEKYRAAEYMNLTDPRTVASIRALETAGLIAAGRADRILAGEEP